MKLQDPLFKPALYALGLGFAALAAVGCAGTGSDTSAQMASETVSKQETVQQTAPIDTHEVASAETNSESGSDAGIAAVVKFAKEVELDESVQQGAEDVPSDEQRLTEVSTAESHASDPTPPLHYVFHFASDSVALDDEAKNELKKHADYLANHNEMTVTISGHSDIQGSNDYNIKLSRQRAETVADVLKSLGVAEDQIIIAGHGEDVPVVDIDNWRENRRVELEYMDDSMLSTR